MGIDRGQLRSLQPPQFLTTRDRETILISAAQRPERDVKYRLIKRATVQRLFITRDD